MSVYAVENLNVEIGGCQIASGLNFAVSAGECLALVGESGSGKSQACLAPFGLSAGRAGGSAILLGQQLVGRPESDLRLIRGRDAGFVFQQPLSALTPHLTIGRQLAESMGTNDHERLSAALADVGLERAAERLRQFPHQLSGGQRQRVMIAMAIAHQPKLLIADEPTTALDAMLRRGILQLLDRLRAERGLAVILVSHDLGLVARHADTVVVMRQGRAVETGEAHTLLAAPRTGYSRALAAAAPKMSAPLPSLPSPGGILLEARNVGVSFRGPGWKRTVIAAVSNASLEVRAGEAVGLVGGSGSGKSTLARAIAGLGPMDEGQILWQGRELARRQRMAFDDRRAIQLVAQDPIDSLDPRWPVAKSIGEGLDPLRLPAAGHPRIAALLEEVRLDPELGGRKPAGLSGGQAQRVAIARALAADPALLVCDEATSALDVTVQAEVTALLCALQQARGLSLLFISHDMALVRQLCHRIVVMDQGRIVEAGPVSEVLASPRADVTKRLVEASD